MAKTTNDLQSDLSDLQSKKMDQIYQVSTMTSLLDAVYEGDFYLSQIPEFGDFGIGTFNRLDGELIGFDGEFYRLRSSGKAVPVEGSDCSPFCTFTFFKPDQLKEVSEPATMGQIEQQIEQMIPSENIFYAIRIDGKFNKVKTRTVEYQEEPFVPMVEAVKDQPIFEFDDIEGTIVGFWTPKYANGIAVSGFHLHFIDKDRQIGGHVFDYEINKGVIQLSQKTNMNLKLPTTEAFFEANLNPDDLAADIASAEGNPE